MDQSLSRVINALTSAKALSAFAGVLIGGVIFLLVAWTAGYLNKPEDAEQAEQAEPEATPIPPDLSQEKNAAYLATHAKTPGVTVTASGLQYRVIKAGTGAKPASDKVTVKVHYTGKFINGKVFDSSVERGQPIEFPLDGVIKGWTEGLQLMRVGEKAELVIPYNLAYGEEGRGADMPGYQTLVFEVELLAVK